MNMKNRSYNRRNFIKASAAGVAVSTLPLPALATTTPVKFGMLSPLSGSLAPYGPEIVKGAEVVAQLINEAGGILGGRQIELVVEDSESNSTSAVRAARKLLDVDQVNSIIGILGSGPTLAIKPLAIEQGVSVNCLGSADEITEGDTQGLMWRFQATGREWGIPPAKVMLEAGHKKVGILGVQTSFTQSMIGPFVETIEAGGGEVIVQAEVKPDQPSFKAEVEHVMGEDVTAVFLPALLPQFTAIAKDWFRGGFDCELYTLSIAASAGKNGGGDFIEAVGKNVGEGIHHLQATNDTKSETYKEFEALMGVDPGTFLPFAALCADSLVVNAAAMEKAGTSNATAYGSEILGIANGPGDKVGGAVNLLQKLRAGSEVDYVGYGVDVAFSDNGNLQNRPFAHFVIKDGKDVELGIV